MTYFVNEPMKIAILLTAYNGERYIAQQLDSIAGQTFGDWVLYVRDDCSTDGTMDIVRSYAKKDDRIVIVEDGGKLGAMEGFMYLTGHASADYYMFSDHDDVWLKDKIEVTLEKMLETEQAHPGTPVIIGTDQTLVDGNLDVIHGSYRKVTHFPLSQLNDKYFHLFYNDVQGCTMMLNSMARDNMFPYGHDVVMHDWWAMVTVLWKGGIVGYVDRPTMLYRQHSGNHTGVGKIRSIWKKVFFLGPIKEKTRRQYESTKCLTGMGRLRFVLMKTRYMLKMQWNIRFKGAFDKQNRL